MKIKTLRFTDIREAKFYKEKRRAEAVIDYSPPCILKILENPDNEKLKLLVNYLKNVGVTNESIVEFLRALVNDIPSDVVSEIVKSKAKYVKCEDMRKLGLCDDKCDAKKSNIAYVMNYFFLKFKQIIIPTTVGAVYEEIESDLKVYVPNHIEKFRYLQSAVINTLCLKIKKEPSFVFQAPTGYGKSLCITVASRLLNEPVAILTLNRALQDQYYEVWRSDKDKYFVILKGKHNYRCKLIKTTVELAPCTMFDDFICEKSSECEYAKAVANANKVLALGKPGIVVLNFQLVGRLYDSLVTVIFFDEAHALLENLSQTNVIIIDKHSEDPIESLHECFEIYTLTERELVSELSSIDVEEREFIEVARQLANIRRKLQTIDLLLKCKEYLIFQDLKSLNKYRIFVPEKSLRSVLEESLPGCKVWVTATPTYFQDLPKVTVDYSVLRKENAPIVYLPVGKLTSKSVSSNKEILKVAAELIRLLFDQYRKFGLTEKCVVHCGNTKEHMKVCFDELSRYYKVIRHEKGELEKTIRKFRKGDYDVLLVASANEGFDFPEVGLQFIYKVPYPDLASEEWQLKMKKFGKEKTMEEYELRTVAALVQACSRVARSEDKTSVTYILDEKFEELYKKRMKNFPKDFRERLIGI